MIKSILNMPSWAALAIVFVIGVGSGTWATAEVFSGKIAKIKLKYADEKNQAILQARLDERSLGALALHTAVAQAKTEVQIVTETVTLKEKVPVYVTNYLPCVSYGLVRVLDAAVLRVDPETLVLPPGQSDDSCAPIGAVDLAKSVAGNYGTAHLNAEQLNGLIDYDARLDKIITGDK